MNMFMYACTHIDMGGIRNTCLSRQFRNSGAKALGHALLQHSLGGAFFGQACALPSVMVYIVSIGCSVLQCFLILVQGSKSGPISN
jgi:hypothetical protein